VGGIKLLGDGDY